MLRGTVVRKSVLVAAALGVCSPVLAQSVTFPKPDRPVASIVSSSWDQEHRRDEQGEAERVFRLLELGPGMRVADIGAGSGYYTARLAKLLGPEGIVYAEDIQEDYVEALRRRVTSESLATVR